LAPKIAGQFCGKETLAKEKGIRQQANSTEEWG
jgi:hypothetical protein